MPRPKKPKVLSNQEIFRNQIRDRLGYNSVVQERVTRQNIWWKLNPKAKQENKKLSKNLFEQFLNPRTTSETIKSLSDRDFELFARFFKYFPHNEKYIRWVRKYNYKPKSKDNRVTEGWEASKPYFCLSASKVIQSILHHNALYGHSAGSAPTNTKKQERLGVWFLLFDIDIFSKYLTNDYLHYILYSLEECGLNGVVYQSNTGKHIYVPLHSPTTQYKATEFFNLFCQKYGLEQRLGQLECFPNPERCIRYPLQKNFAFLDQSTFEVTHECTSENSLQSLKMFVDDLENTNPDIGFWEFEAIVTRFTRERRFREANRSIIDELNETDPVESIEESNEEELTGYFDQNDVFVYFEKETFFNLESKLPERWEEGREAFTTGLTEPSTRHYLMQCVCHYLYMGDSSNRIFPLKSNREKLFEELWKWISTNHNGLSKDFNSNPDIVMNDAKSMAYWSNKSKSVIKQKPVINQDKNIQSALKTQVKIQGWINVNKAMRIRSIRMLADKIGVSIPSLYKYKHLWEGQVKLVKSNLKEMTSNEMLKQASRSGVTKQTNSNEVIQKRTTRSGVSGGLFKNNKTKNREQKKVAEQTNKPPSNIAFNIENSDDTRPLSFAGGRYNFLKKVELVDTS